MCSLFNSPTKTFHFKIQRCFIFFVCLICFWNLRLYSQEKAIEISGDILLYAMPTISLGSTLVIGDKQGTWQFLKGFAVNEAMTFGLKLAISKPRPNEANNNSFPSGHTSTTFQSAAFIQKRYGWKYGIPAYALAGFTGFSRIYADQHDILDVLAGVRTKVVKQPLLNHIA